MICSTEYEFKHAHKCLNAKNFWHINIYSHDKYNIWEFESIKSLLFSILCLWAIEISGSAEFSMKKVK